MKDIILGISLTFNFIFMFGFQASIKKMKKDVEEFKKDNEVFKVFKERINKKEE